ncbi:MAG: hypothetical protein ACREFE_03660 [Limisphaerales bacterium]
MKAPDISQAPIVKRFGVRGARLFARIWFPILYFVLAAITAGLWIVSPAFAGGWRRITTDCVIGALVVTAASLLTHMCLKFLAEIAELEMREKMP